MPEGPSLVILKDEIARFRNKKILAVAGNAKIDLELIKGKKLIDIRVWGKQLFLVFETFAVRIHLLMFGSYSVDLQTRPDKSLRLKMEFRNGSVYFYTCSVRIIDVALDKMYDWTADVLSEKWNPRKARKKLKLLPNEMVCDVLLEQDIFSGVGNIIKNEVLFRIRMHPESLIGAIPPRKLTELVSEARNYSFDFLKWKRAYVLRKHWLAHTKKICARCNLPLIKKYTGKRKRRSFFCNNCQVRYR